MIEAVVFDLGGVVLDSPLHEIARFELDRDLDPGIVNRAVRDGGWDGAWACHERGEIDSAEFAVRFAAELAATGAHDVDVDEMMSRIGQTSRPRPAMLAAIAQLRAGGLRTAALTNNWPSMRMGHLRSHFDLVVESAVEGVRKPEPEIYLRLLSRLGVEPGRVLYLDDLGANLKPARELGMTTVKVVDVESALVGLTTQLGIDLT